MAGSFPGARDLDEYLAVIQDGRRTTDIAANPAGAEAEVLAGGVLDGAGLFDADFFGYSPREAARIDPQQRVFLEYGWAALEHAGYGGGAHSATVGVYAGASLSTYLLRHLLPAARSADDWADMLLGNSPDMLATRLAYHLDLKGPAMTVQTACSTSLVAVHLACQGLLAGDCGIAVAGGVSIRLPQVTPHGADSSGILSPDGLCLPFDARAAGTVDGNGVGVVVLKPLATARADRDTIHAVIKATALNNDGRNKVGFVAPSVRGQAGVIRLAHAIAGIDPSTIGYIETHGTATALGDPIEFAALAQAFGDAEARRRDRCTLGSVKAQIGHLDAAAGVASLIKAVLAVERGFLPPSPYFESPNPQIDLEDSPFQLIGQARDWVTGGGPRRAGVSSFGMGGTNAHMVLEQATAPAAPLAPARREHQLALVSARTPTALDQARAALRQHLATEDPDIADVAYRMAVVCASSAEAAHSLASGAPELMTGRRPAGDRAAVFMFSGQGAQYPGMGASLYRSEPEYRHAFDECAELLVPHLGLDIRDLVLAGGQGKRPLETDASAAQRLRRTEFAQPTLFAVEYALARLWSAWGIRPAAMIGHSVGEFAAACLAGTMSLADAAALIARRGKLMQGLPAGWMLSVGLGAGEAERFASAGVAVAADNGPALSVLSGPPEEMGEVERRLIAQGVAVRRLHTSHAFHSPAMEPIVEHFLGRSPAAARPFRCGLAGPRRTRAAHAARAGARGHARVPRPAGPAGRAACGGLLTAAAGCGGRG
jgi:acyl transferase domain-containing protein